MSDVIPKGTIYDFDPVMGYQRTEGRNITHGTRRLAQYRNAVLVRFTPRGKRKQTSLGSTSRPGIVVLEGWDHPDLGTAIDVVDKWTDERFRYRIESPRYEFDSAEWEGLFNSRLRKYLEETGVRVLADYREHLVETTTREVDPEIARVVQEIVGETSHEIDSQPGSTILPTEILDTATLVEGATKTVTVNAFERSRKARQACIAHYGARCFVCTLELGERYGSIGKDFIEVHHVVPLSEIGEAYEVDPIKDLRPVCPNCHSMLHRRIPPLLPEELRDLLSKGKVL